MAMKRRTDNKGRILRVGESQRKDVSKHGCNAALITPTVPLDNPFSNK